MISKLLLVMGFIFSYAAQGDQGEESTPPIPIEQQDETREAVFAMGCFWCTESAFRDHNTHKPLPGIRSLKVGYAGGTMPNPTEKNHRGYKEAIKVTFSPSEISYETLLDIFWHNIDPFDGLGQFCEKGYAYTAVIYVGNEEQRKAAEKSKDDIEKKLGNLVATEIKPLTTFVHAEKHHQKYKSKNPLRYKFYRWR